MRKAAVVAVTGLMILGLLVFVGCGGKETTGGSTEGAATVKEAIVDYCDENKIDIPDLNISQDNEVSAQDPDWEVDYAFPAAAEGEGYFFLMHKVDGDWTVVADTEKAGWTAEQLEALGAPSDLVL